MEIMQKPMTTHLDRKQQAVFQVTLITCKISKHVEIGTSIIRYDIYSRTQRQKGIFPHRRNIINIRNRRDYRSQSLGFSGPFKARIWPRRICAEQESELDFLCKIRRIPESIAQTTEEAEHLYTQGNCWKRANSPTVWVKRSSRDIRTPKLSCLWQWELTSHYQSTMTLLG